MIEANTDSQLPFDANLRICMAGGTTLTATMEPAAGAPHAAPSSASVAFGKSVADLTHPRLACSPSSDARPALGTRDIGRKSGDRLFDKVSLCRPATSQFLP
jgi:hypothetical protein